MLLPPRVWKFVHSRRVWWAVAVLPFALGVLGAGYYGVVNWWGERKLGEYRMWLAANGYAVTLREYYPVVGNPEEDVLHHPALVAELAAAETLGRVQFEPMRSQLAGLAGWAKHAPKVNHEGGEHHDVRAWFDPPRHASEAEAAQEVLRALVAERERIGGVVMALGRPECAWQEAADIRLHGEESMKMLGLSGFAGDLAVVELAAGDAEAAARLLEAQLKLAGHFYRRPNLLRCLLAQVVLDQAQTALHEGIARHAWDEETLGRLAEAVSLLDPQASSVGCLRGEIPFSLEWLPEVLEARDPRFFAGWEPDGGNIVERIGEIWSAVGPGGEWQLDFVEFQQRLVAESEARKGPRQLRFSRGDGLEFERKKDATRAGPGQDAWHLLAILATSALQGETSVALMGAGIALERSRLKYGAHPEALGALVPEFLSAVPRDPYDLRPLRCRALADGTPLVWSIGPDGIDNRGAAAAPEWHRRPNQPDHDRCWVTRPLVPGE